MTKTADRKPFKAGEAVMVKGGGPRMTVETDEFCDRVECIWFDVNHESCHSREFVPETLQRIAP